LLVTVAWALMSLVLFERRAPIDTYPALITAMACALAVMVFVRAVGAPTRARQLWLRCGDSRTAVFRTVENSIWWDVTTLSVVSWLAVTALAYTRGLDVGFAEAFTLLLGCAIGALAPLYFGLILPTLTAGWQRIPAAVLATIAFVAGPIWWIDALRSAENNWEAPQWKWLLVLTGITVALRTMALWRWKTIDWTRLNATVRLVRDAQRRRA
jgi:hypothetical protein